jgi:hypothetical protein
MPAIFFPFNFANSKFLLVLEQQGCGMPIRALLEGRAQTVTPQFLQTANRESIKELKNS